MNSSLELQKKQEFEKTEQKIKEQTEVYIIKKGDNLSKINSKLGLGNNLDLMFALNPGLTRQTILNIESTRPWSKINVPKGYNANNKVQITNSISKIQEVLQIYSKQLISKETQEKLDKFQAGTLDKKELTEFKTLIQKEFENYEIFQKTGVSLGLGGVLDAVKNSIQYTCVRQKNSNGEYIDPEGDNPRVLDERFVRETSCAGYVRNLINQATSNNDLTEKEKAFLKKENVDAWMLPNELGKVGWTQERNYMKYLNLNYADSVIPATKKDYEKEIGELGSYILKNGDKLQGGFLPLVFTGTRARSLITGWNSKMGLTGDSRHLNSHQTLILGNTEVTLGLSDIPDMSSGKKEWNSKERTVENYLVDFISHRSDIGNNRNLIKDGLKKYSTSLKIYLIDVNGKETQIKSEDFSKTQIKKGEKIKIFSTLTTDGFHKSGSTDKDMKEKNNMRTRFVFEFLACQKYKPTELISPPNREKSNFFTKNISNNSEIQIDGGEIKIEGLYTIKKGQILKDVLRNEILKREIDKIIEIVGYNKQKTKDEIKNVINNHLLNGKTIDSSTGIDTVKLDNLIKSIELKQIRGLQMSGYINGENGETNETLVRENHIIPYFDLGEKLEGKEILDTFSKYVQIKKKQFSESNEKNIGDYYVITLVYGDTRQNINTRLQEYIKNKYPKQYKILQSFTDSQKRIFLYKVFCEAICNENIGKGEKVDIKNVLFGKKLIPGEKYLIENDIIKKTIEEIQLGLTGDSEKYGAIEGYNSNCKKLDTEIINRINPTESGRNQLKSVLFVESYDGCGIFGRKHAKLLMEKVGKANSLGENQIRIDLNSVKAFENGAVFSRKNLNGAIEFLENNKDLLKGINTKEDFVHIENIKKILKKEKITQDDLKKIEENLEKIIRIDALNPKDNDFDNVVGRIISTYIIDKKISQHNENLSGTIEKICGKNLEINSLTNKDYIARLNNMTLLTNNVGEGNTWYSITENFIIRLLKQNGISVYTPEIETGLLTGGAKYGKNTFLKHLTEISKQIDGNNSTIAKLVKNYTKVLNSKEEYKTEIVTKQIGKEFTTTKVKIPVKQIGLSDIYELYNFNSDLYKGFTDKEKLEIKKIFNIDNPINILPTQEEILDKTDFASKVFNYTRKIIKG